MNDIDNLKLREKCLKTYDLKRDASTKVTTESKKPIILVETIKRSFEKKNLSFFLC